jgi:hypothetical protein
VVLSALAADAIVARIRAWRHWPRSNAWLAQAALLGLTIPLALYQLLGAGNQTRAEQATFAGLSQALPAALEAAGVTPGTPLITDRPIWLSGSLGRPGLALPDEPATDILGLARRFGAQAIVVVEPGSDARSSGPAWAGDTCFRPIALGVGASQAAGFVISEACR